MSSLAIATDHIKNPNAIMISPLHIVGVNRIQCQLSANALRKFSLVFVPDALSPRVLELSDIEWKWIKLRLANGR